MMRRRSRQESAPPSLWAVSRATWAALAPPVRRKLVASSVASAVLAGVDAVAVGLLPALVHRLVGAGASDPPSILPLAVLVGCLLATKTVVSAVLLQARSSIIARAEGEQAVAAFDQVLEQQFGVVAAVNSNVIIREIRDGIPAVYRSAASSLSMIVADGATLVALVVALLATAPISAVVVVATVAIGSILYQRGMRGSVGSISVRFRQEEADCSRELTEAMEGLKTIKAFGVETAALDRYAAVRLRHVSSVRGMLLHSNLSRYFIELLIVVALGVALGAESLVNGRTAVVGAFAVLTGFMARATPAVLRTLSGATNIELVGASVLALQDGISWADEPTLEQPAPDLEPEPEGDVVLRLGGVSFRYPGALVDAVEDVSFEVRRGEVVALQGESGAGKSTLVDLLLGLRFPRSGVVHRAASGTVGFVAQDTFVWDDSVRFNVTLGRSLLTGSAEDEVWRALELAHLASWVRTLPEGLDARLGERGSWMSGGQRQRLGLARALFSHPAALVLDEPTSALDAATTRSLMETVHDLAAGVGTLIVTHDPLVAELSDRQIVLARPAGRAGPSSTEPTVSPAVPEV